MLKLAARGRPTNPMTTQPSILVTGATGTNGAELLKLFAAHQIPVRALTRNAAHARDIAAPNVQIVEGDFGDADSLRAALRHIERAFLVSPSSQQAQEQQLAFVEAARQSGVSHLVKLSQLGADVHSPERFLRYHGEVEAAIRNSQLRYTFLRPNLFMQSFLGFAPVIKQKHAIFAPMGDGKISIVDVRDIMEIAFLALTQAGHENQTYNITGPQALTHRQMAAQFSEALGHEISYSDIAPAAMREALVGAGFPQWQADGLLEEYAHWSQNSAAQLTPDVKNVTGHKPRTFAQFARDYAGEFS